MLNIQIITPTGIAFEGTCEEIVLPAETGQIGVRTGHRPLITALKAGAVRIKEDGNEQRFEIKGGFADINAKEAIVTTRSVKYA